MRPHIKNWYYAVSLWWWWRIQWSNVCVFWLLFSLLFPSLFLFFFVSSRLFVHTRYTVHTTHIHTNHTRKYYTYSVRPCLVVEHHFIAVKPDWQIWATWENTFGIDNIFGWVFLFCAFNRLPDLFCVDLPKIFSPNKLNENVCFGIWKDRFDEQS